MVGVISNFQPWPKGEVRSGIGRIYIYEFKIYNNLYRPAQLLSYSPFVMFINKRLFSGLQIQLKVGTCLMTFLCLQMNESLPMSIKEFQLPIYTSYICIYLPFSPSNYSKSPKNKKPNMNN